MALPPKHRQDREQRPSFDPEWIGIEALDGKRKEGREHAEDDHHAHRRVLQGQNGRQEHAGEEGRHQRPSEHISDRSEVQGLEAREHAEHGEEHLHTHQRALDWERHDGQLVEEQHPEGTRRIEPHTCSHFDCGQAMTRHREKNLTKNTSKYSENLRCSPNHSIAFHNNSNEQPLRSKGQLCAPTSERACKKTLLTQKIKYFIFKSRESLPETPN